MSDTSNTGSIGIQVHVSHVEWRETFQPTLNFELRRVPSALAVQSARGSSALGKHLSPVVGTWNVSATNSLPFVGTLPIEDLADGDYILACWTGAAVFTPGEPYGCARFTATSGVQGRVAIELAEVNASMPRLDLSAILARQAAFVQEMGEMAEGHDDDPAYVAARNICFADCKAFIDRGAWAQGDLSASYHIGADNAPGKMRVRVIRSAINGNTLDGVVVLDRMFPNEERNVLTEADMLANTSLGWDLDWDGAVQAYVDADLPWGEIVNVTYRIVIGEGTIADDETNNNLCALFVNRFEYGVLQAPVTDLAVSSGVATWLHVNAISKAYPACQVRVWSDSTYETLKWDSGVVRAPMRDANGYYHFNLPAEAIPPTGSSYYIGVSMLDAKFTAPDDDYETRSQFDNSAGETPRGLIDAVANVTVPVSVSAVDWRAAAAPSSLRFEARKIASTDLLDFAPADYKDAPYIFGEALASWTVPITKGLPYVGNLPPVPAKLPVGDYVLSCWEGDSDYQVGNRFGCARFTIATGESTTSRVFVEITEIHPSVPRIDLTAGTTDRELWDFEGFDATSEGQVTADAKIVHTNRTAINGSSSSSYEALDVATPFRLVPGQRFISEADLLIGQDLGHDLDWGGAVQAYVDASLAWGEIVNVTYRIVIGSNSFSTSFSNGYTYGICDLAVTNLMVSDGVASWRHASDIDKSLPACQIRVWSDSGYTTLKWDSEVIKAPVRDADGYYRFTLPAAAIPPSGSTWYIGVSMCDAKFTEGDEDETRVSFTTP